MRNQADIDAFYESTKMKAERFDFVEHPTLPRKWKTPIYKTQEQYFIVDGLPKVADAHHLSNPKKHYCQMYFEVLDSIITVIEDRLDRKSFQAYLLMESLLLKPLHGACVKSEIEFLNDNYGAKITTDLLESELEIWKTVFNDSKPLCFKDIHSMLGSLSESKRKQIPNLINICQLLIVNPATSCTTERSFLTAQRLKSWLRASLTSKQFNAFAILNSNKDLMDKLDLKEIGNEFISKNDECFCQFGRFTKEDFSQVFRPFRIKPFLIKSYFYVDKMTCAENLTSFTGNIMSFFSKRRVPFQPIQWAKISKFSLVHQTQPWWFLLRHKLYSPPPPISNVVSRTL